MSRWKKIGACAFIAAWACCMGAGIVGHALRVGICGNTLSYFVVWDMFCGWSAWDQETHIIAEGSSGKYYEVKEPWGEFRPFGHRGRIQYDHTNHMLSRHVENILSHTDHERIDRVFIVQEVWPKQYNLPPKLYSEYFEQEQDKVSYFNLRAVCAANGQPVQSYQDWFARQRMASTFDNPRIRQQASSSTSMYNTFFNPRTQNESAIGLSTN